jgi:excisionase family DNA binding protein
MVSSEKSGVRLLTVKEAAVYLGLKYERVLLAIHQGQLPAITIGARRMVSIAALDRVLLEGEFTRED